MSDRPFDYQDYRNRYAQHIMFYEAGVSNREKVFNARVAVIGLGAITLEAARLLTVAGVRLLRFVYWEAETTAASDTLPQAEAAEYLPRGLGGVQALAEANPSVAVEVVNAAEVADFDDLLRDADLVLYEDGDGARCREVAESAAKLKVTWIYAQAHGGSGMTVSVIPGQTACIGCIKSKTQSEGPQLSYAANVTDLIARTISQVQAMEALKLLGESPNISTDVYRFDVDNFGQTLNVTKDQACPTCNL
jgi:adenylyltransferase/sulfurtransferase